MPERVAVDFGSSPTSGTPRPIYIEKGEGSQRRAEPKSTATRDPFQNLLQSDLIPPMLSKYFKLSAQSESLFKPQETVGIKSGHVVLKKGEASGRHSTQDREEILIIRSGKGILEIDGKDALRVDESYTVYIPPQTWHNVKNDTKKILDYVYVTAPIK